MLIKQQTTVIDCVLKLNSIIFIFKRMFFCIISLFKTLTLSYPYDEIADPR